MGLLNTAMNAIGTVAAVKSLFGQPPPGNRTGRLNDFMTEIRTNSVSRTNLFEVEITAPKIMAGNGTLRKLSLYAEGTQLPGRNIQTADLKRFGVGPQEKIPYSIQYNDVTLSFIGDGKGDVYKFFYNWMQGIVRGDYEVTSLKTDRGGKSPYEVEFKDQYAVPIKISTFNEQGQEVLVSVLSEAYPINVPDVNLNWSDTGMMQFSVTFAYLQAQLVTSETPLVETKNGFNSLSPFQKLAKIGTAIQTIASLKKPAGVQDALSSVTTIKNIFR